VIVVIEDGHQFQVATFRAEADYQDGRRPEHVTFGDAKADAERRDFTVNGVFFDPVKNELRDWVGGEKDLRAKIIRTIGSPNERFAEDHLRLLRAVWLAVQLGFDIEPETFAAVKANAAKIKVISAERIRDELVKLFAPAPSPQPSPPMGAREKKSRVSRDLESGAHFPESGDLAGSETGVPKAARGLVLLRESGLLEHVLPEVAATVGCEQSPDF